MFWEEQAAVLERVAAGHPLGEILADIVRMIERQATGMSCSILLIDEDGVTIRHGAAPSLPPEFVAHLDGLKIGPTAGSCGTAAYRRERVIVEDIATHPYWESYRALALPFGLRACWSSPVMSAEREVLGTFAMYYREPRTPSATELSWVDAATHLAAIAVLSDRAKRSLRQSEARAKHMARLYAMASAINEAIVRERDASRLYHTACRIAVEHGIVRLAWVGLVDHATRKIVAVAHAGAGFVPMSAIHIDLADDRVANDPAAAAVQSGVPAVIQDLARHPTLHWKQVAREHQLGSCAIVPLRERGATTGILVLYAAEANAFGEEETVVLASLADDITFAIDSARTAAELRQSEERLRSIIEHTPDVAIQWYDDDGRLIFYNEASQRVFGWTERGALGKTLLETGFWSANEEAQFAIVRSRAAAGVHVAPTRFRFSRADGTDGYLLSTVFTIPLSDTQRCHVCMDVDLTEHHRMEVAVRAGETLRALIYDCVNDVIFYLAVEGDDRFRFQSVNRAFIEATGLTEADVVGKLVDEVIPAAALTLVKSKYREAIATRDRVVWEEVTQYPSGMKYGEVTVGPIYGPDGSCTHLVGTVHDVTARRTAEREVREIQAQLHQSERLQSLGTLAGGIAHDFNNILTAIRCNVDIALARIETGGDVRQHVIDIRQATERATALTRQILTFSRKDDPKLERLDLRPVIDEALRLSRVAIRGRTKLRAQLDDDTPPVRGDATQVHQVVMNLVTNAAQALGDGGGEIAVRLERAILAPGARSDAPDGGTYARLTVADDGPGMDAATRARVFEPFFTTKPAGEGTGLGLSVVHGIVKTHGGTIVVQSELGRGTTFEVLFPAEGAREAATAPRVLFVDGDEAMLFLAQRAFLRQGHTMTACASAAEALRQLEREPAAFDVVVVDLDMPDVTREIVRTIRRAQLRVVATSSTVREADITMAKELDVLLLHRPQSLDDLAKLVTSR
jgi:two-component system cell cycle sensor histidine kinase/response regulator CckA